MTALVLSAPVLLEVGAKKTTVMGYRFRSGADSKTRRRSHRLWVGLDVLVPAPCPSRLIPEHTAQDGIQSALEYPRQGHSTPALGHLLQHVFTCTLKFFLKFRWNFLSASFCPLSLFLWVGDAGIDRIVRGISTIGGNYVQHIPTCQSGMSYGKAK